MGKKIPTNYSGSIKKATHGLEGYGLGSSPKGHRICGACGCKVGSNSMCSHCSSY